MAAAAAADLPAGWLPRAGSVLAVLARPGQETAELGGLLYAFRRAGADLALLCLTRGQGLLGELHLECAGWKRSGPGSCSWRPRPGHLPGHGGQLSRRRPGQAAEAALGERIGRAIRQHAADLLLVIDPAAGDADDDGSAMDDAAAAAAA